MRFAALTIFFSLRTLSAQPTYASDVAPIMQAKCQQCHRPNQIAPFSLLTYDDAVTYARDIQNAVGNNIMPPWKPVPGIGDFKNSYGLTDDERQTILTWISNGAPLGDPADLPAPPPVSDSPWQLGAPDAVFQLPQYTPPADATDMYRCFSVPTGFAETKYAAALEVLPGARQIVHHALVFLDPFGDSAPLDGQDGQPGYTCFGGPGFTDFGGPSANPLANLRSGKGLLAGSWVPGARVQRLDPGIGVTIPANSRLVVQVHYHPAGRTLQDQSQFGIYFAPSDSIQHRMVSVPIVNTSFTIPAGAANYEVQANRLFPPLASGKLILVTPHMHLLGRTFRIILDTPDGNSTPLIFINDWDFNWQGGYYFQNAIALPGNSTIRVSATYDNSDANPRNPNTPLQDVSWGEKTTDEMCLGGLGIIFDNEDLLLGPMPEASNAPATRRRR